MIEAIATEVVTKLANKGIEAWKNKSERNEAVAAFHQAAEVDTGGRTALHYAAAAGRADVVPALLEDGANIEAKDKNGATALHIAAEFGKADVVKVLLEHDVAKVLLGFLTERARDDNDGRTALHIAAEFGKTDVVKVLLEHGANVGATNKEGATALQVAVGAGKTDVVMVLLEAGADKDRRTALHIAAAAGKADMVKELLEARADVRVRDKNGATPRDLATHEDIIQLLDKTQRSRNTKIALLCILGISLVGSVMIKSGPLFILCLGSFLVILNTMRPKSHAPQKPCAPEKGDH